MAIGANIRNTSEAFEDNTGNPSVDQDLPNANNSQVYELDKPAQAVAPANAPQAEDERYSVFSKRKKQAIVGAASVGAVFSTLTAQAYLPALQVLADDFQVSITDINLTVTTYLIFQGVTPLVIGSAADKLGRRPAYIVCFIVYLAANIGLALAPNYASLLGIRCLQAAGISGTQTLCQAVVADTVTSAERGQYIGFVTLSAVIGPALGPLIGGGLATSLGWRSIFWFLTICAGAILLLTVLFFPETCRPLVGNGSKPPPATNMTVLQLLAHINAQKPKANSRSPVYELDGPRDVEDGRLFNPAKEPMSSTSQRKRRPLLTALHVLKDKELLILLVYGGLIYSGINAISAAVPPLFARIYGYNSLQIGLIYLPMAGGSVVAIFVAGRLITLNFKRHAKKLEIEVETSRQADLSEFPIERARLEVLLPPLYCTAIVIIAWGWALEARTSVAVPIVLSFLLGVVYISVLNVFNTLITDLYRKKAGSAVAANWFVRCAFAAAMTAAINPIIVAIGPGWAYTIIGGAYVLFSPALMLIMWKGMSWRKERKGKDD